MKFSKAPWRTVQIGRRHITEVRDARGDTVCVVYTNGDSRGIVRVPELVGSLKHLIAIVRLRTDLRASERAKYEAAVKLLGEFA